MTHSYYEQFPVRLTCNNLKKYNTAGNMNPKISFFNRHSTYRKVRISNVIHSLKRIYHVPLYLYFGPTFAKLCDRSFPYNPLLLTRSSIFLSFIMMLNPRNL
ncbi:hypothetical protein HanHA300_Chr10g0352341 [Helianthus annuus]|nr:hypothetical protein HanHA300_Chr10g0352341 [Helianthus annuus]KAJ0529108.1 hypothetical protein HanHA89_Chr10g0374001 [Helianthus annuus]